MFKKRYLILILLFVIGLYFFNSKVDKNISEVLSKEKNTASLGLFK